MTFNFRTSKKFFDFQTKHEEALQTIERFLAYEEGETMHEFVAWLLSTPHNPYGFLPEQWAGAISTAEGLASFLYVVHHALYDDGDITFVSVDDFPRIVFAWRYEDNFRDCALTAQEKSLERQPVFGKLRSRSVEILEISLAEFGALVDAAALAALKKQFACDAGREGIVAAVHYYKDRPGFSDSWLAECSEDIGRWQKFYKEG